jgi:hypothetical protein
VNSDPSQPPPSARVSPTAPDVINPPLYGRYGVDWSVKVLSEGVCRDRFVVYGLEREAIEAYLAERGCPHGVSTLEAVLARVGEPFRVMAGADGPRTKLYGDLPGDDPGMVCVDLWPDGRHAVRTYRRCGPSGVEAALAACAPALQRELTWLMTQEPFASTGPFHVAMQRSTEDGPYTGADFGFVPDWEALAARDEGLRRRELVLAMLQRHGVEHQWPAVEAALWSGPLGVTNYVGFRLMPDGRFAVNVYAVLNTVVARQGRLVQMDVAGQGFSARPLRLSFELHGSEDVVFRLNPKCDEPAFVTVGDWLLVHSALPDELAAALHGRGVFRTAQAVAERAALLGTPAAPLGALHALRAAPEVRRAWLEPRCTGDHVDYGICYQP